MSCRVITILHLLLLLASCSKTSPLVAQSPAIVIDAGTPVIDLTNYLRIYAGTTDLEEPTRIVAQLQRRPSEELGLISHLPFNQGRVWLSFRLDNPTAQSVPMVLVNYFPALSVWVIREAAGLGQEINRYGVAELSDIGHSGPLPEFHLKVPPGVSTFYVGFSPLGEPCIAQLKLWHESAYKLEADTYVVIVASMFSAIATLTLFTTLLTLIVRDKTLALWVAVSVTFTLLMGVIYGLHMFLPDPLNVMFAKAWPIWDSAAMTLMSLYFLNFLDIKSQTHPKLVRFYLVFFGCSALFLPVYYFISAEWASALYLPLSSTALIVSLIVAARLMVQRNKQATFYFFSFLPVLLCSTLTAISLLRIIPYDFVYIHLQIIAGMANFLVSSIGIGTKIAEARNTHNALKLSLRGVIADDQIEKIATSSMTILRKPVDQQVSIMFVDIVGYSMFFKRMGPHQAFYALKETLGELTAIVHRHGGVIDKSLGDGILCFFGYSLTGQARDDHASMAYRCAIQMQELALSNTLKASHEGASLEKVCPLRIGINTATVYIGNMGDEKRLDITVSGDGVVLASRFEAACEPYKIILGETTHNGLTEEQKNGLGFNKILVPIKHQQSLLEAYEFNPFSQRPDDLRGARSVYWHINEKQQLHPRQATDGLLAFSTPYGVMQVVNFSNGGFCLNSTAFLGRGTSFELKLDALENHPQSKLISPLLVEVIWGMTNNSGTYQHGVKIVGANAAQRLLVFELLQKHVNRYVESPPQSLAS